MSSFLLTCSLLWLTKQDLGLASCGLLWTRRCRSLSLKRSDGVVCSAERPLCLEVKGGVVIVLRMPVCPSHISDGDREEQISTFCTRHLHTCKVIGNRKQQHEKAVKGERIQKIIPNFKKSKYRKLVCAHRSTHLSSPLQLVKHYSIQCVGFTVRFADCNQMNIPYLTFLYRACR